MHAMGILDLEMASCPPGNNDSKDPQEGLKCFYFPWENPQCKTKQYRRIVRKQKMADFGRRRT